MGTLVPSLSSIGPTIEALANQLEGRAKITKVDVDQNPEVASEYGIASIRPVLIFRDGREIDQSWAFSPYPLRVGVIGETVAS